MNNEYMDINTIIINFIQSIPIDHSDYDINHYSKDIIKKVDEGYIPSHDTLYLVKRSLGAQHSFYRSLVNIITKKYHYWLYEKPYMIKKNN